MRYKSDHKEKARQNIIDAAAKAMKVCGFDGIGVDAMASRAGVTSGAFYSNFASKEAVLAEVVKLRGSIDDIDFASGTALERRQRLAEFVRFYLSTGHCDNSEEGCVLPALTADVSRAGATVKAAYQQRTEQTMGCLMKAFDGAEADNRKTAWALTALMNGAVAMTRALPAGAVREEARAAAVEAAFALIGVPLGAPASV